MAVISSALCGMVSGSSVGNTVTTGSVTIPMMKKTGYKPEFAGAVEAAASTGGQIMPPIMGAAAFLMAEYMNIPYAQVAVKAILPAVLYFTGIFIAVHLEAKKLGLKGIPKDRAAQVLGELLKQALSACMPLVAAGGPGLHRHAVPCSSPPRVAIRASPSWWAFLEQGRSAHDLRQNRRRPWRPAPRAPSPWLWPAPWLA